MDQEIKELDDHGTPVGGDRLVVQDVSDDATEQMSVDDLKTYLTDSLGYKVLGRHELASAADSLSVTSLEENEHLIILAFINPTGTVTARMRFNADSANNYAQRESTDGAADNTVVSTSSISCRPASSRQSYISAKVINIDVREKLALVDTIGQGTPGAANAPTRREIYGKWVNTAVQITSVSITNDDTGDYAAGSKLLVLGRD